jgi:hypothetical protein
MRHLFILLFTLLPLASAEVKIVPAGTGFQLLRNGQNYFINGAGGMRSMELLPPAGANSVRSWSPPTDADMNKAHSLGLSVMVGLPVGKPRQGFDYSDAAAVQKQRERVRELVRKYKDHPAVLIWALGNESELRADEKTRIVLWKEIEELAKIVKQEDASHPVITVLAGVGRSNLIELIQHCPTLDAVGINTYGGMLKLPQAVQAQGWKKAWMVTEFGPRGHWEVDKTPWGLPIEDTSTEKAEFYAKAYESGIKGQPACLGSYVFQWGQKQEKTHTWYGLFLPEGDQLNPVDVMTEGWSGKPPVNRAPRTGRIVLTGAIESGRGWARVKTGQKLPISVKADDPDGDLLFITWDLRKDVSDNPNTGGDREPPVEPIDGAIDGSNVVIPKEPGNYRLFVYARDGKGKAATANVALLAEGQ